MSGYDIGISGLTTAQRAIDVIGNNIANAGTEGYHRQRVDIVPADETYYGDTLIGQGANVARVNRLYSRMLEAEITSQNSSLAMSNRKLDALQIIENSFGELASEGLSTSLDNYFEAMHEMSTAPDNAVLQNKVVRAAESLTYEFRRMGTFLGRMEEDLNIEARQLSDQVNDYGVQIARLNDDITRIELRGASAGNMRDDRDLLVNKLAELANIRVREENGMYNIVIGQTPLVVKTLTTPIQVDLFSDNGELKLGIAAEGATNFSPSISGGELGAVLELRNELLPDYLDKLDTLAQTIAVETNKQHIQGVGVNGSFTDLSGWVMSTQQLSEMEPTVQDGTVYVRVTDSTGNTVRHEVSIDAAVDTLSDVATKFNSIAGFSGCGVVGSQLVLQADSGYTYDFQAGIPPEVTPGGIPLGTSTPELSGVYKGDTNQIYTCSVSGTGGIGLVGGPQVTVTNGAGQVVASFDVGQGYEAGTKLFIDNGISLSFSPGDLNDTSTFTFETLADSDTSGVLAATGINCLFIGTSAATMGVKGEVVDDPGCLAITGGGADMNGSVILAMAEVGSTKYSSTLNLTPEHFYQNLTADIGQDVSGSNIKLDNSNSIMKHLLQQQSDVSGVDINIEATQLMVYERLFQAMSQYLSTVNDSLETLMMIIK